VQGRLRKEYLSVVIETECKHCGQAMRIGVDSDMQISTHDDRNKPWVFMPDVEWSSFTERTIIDAY
jgi:hypothetical protein